MKFADKDIEDMSEEAVKLQDLIVKARDVVGVEGGFYYFQNLVDKYKKKI
jgi:hypothetical protein